MKANDHHLLKVLYIFSLNQYFALLIINGKVFPVRTVRTQWTNRREEKLPFLKINAPATELVTLLQQSRHAMQNATSRDNDKFRAVD